MATLLLVLIAAFGFDATPGSVVEVDLAPLRVTVALLPSPRVVAGELVTVEARVVGPPAGQPGPEVEVAFVDLVLPDGRSLPMVPTPADPHVYTAHVFAEGSLGPGLHELEVVVLDTGGRERSVTLALEVYPSAHDVAIAR